MKKVRHVVFLLFIILLIFSFSGCNKANTEKGNIGDIPPGVIDYSDEIYCDSTDTTPVGFCEYEEWFKESGNGIIAECEMVENGTLVKSLDHTEQGDLVKWNSYVMTPVKILKVHYQGETFEEEIKEGDVVNFREPYFWITSDMEVIPKLCEIGSYLTP